MYSILLAFSNQTASMIGILLSRSTTHNSSRLVAVLTYLLEISWRGSPELKAAAAGSFLFQERVN